jgi:EAL domain-containing protein (putative c-di-GMP-specific phosphodiesterase class I)
LAPKHGSEPAELLQHADLALALGKRHRAGVSIYDPQEGARSRRRLALATDLRVALAEGAVEVWYQPQAEARTGKVVGVEALLRWRHPVFGSVRPDEAITLAEQTGLMPAITEYVLRTALHQRAAWAAGGIRLDVAVNLSARDLMDPQLPAKVAGLLADSGCPAAALTLEITEGTVMEDIDRALEVLAALSALGISLSIDDFGTGYSSLAYLAQLPVHEVKIDKSFVMGMTDRDVIVGATIDLAHALGRRTVAEGVESPQVWEQLRALGCDLIQGFGLLPPTPAQELTAWLTAGAPRRHRQLAVGSRQA